MTERGPNLQPDKGRAGISGPDPAQASVPVETGAGNLPVTEVPTAAHP
jgi:hypothetical protein